MKLCRFAPLLLALSAFAAAQDAVLECERTPAKLSAAQAKFNAADLQLNTVWKEVKAKLPSAQFQKILTEQRAWPEYRDVQAAVSAASGERVEIAQVRGCAELYDAQAAITESRRKYLAALIAPALTDAKFWRGAFSDSFGGAVFIDPRKDGLHFRLDVVRGETFHTGQIGGVAKLTGAQALFITTTDNYETEDANDQLSVRVKFTRVGNVLSIETTNAQNFAGARAYFDGNYARVAELNAEDIQHIDTPEQ
jgi:uncharacterized protein YecT (DUF1311 family)/uncharacterized protein YuzE